MRRILARPVLAALTWIKDAQGALMEVGASGRTQFNSQRGGEAWP